MPKTRSLPSNPNLEKLKKQAKTLLRDFRKKEPEALKLVASLHTGPDSFDGLRDAQLVVARQHGFDGWIQLSQAVEVARLRAADGRARVDKFLVWASDHDPGRWAAAAWLLREFPEIAHFDVYTAAASAEEKTLDKLLNEHPELATTRGGPRGWSPLLYLCNCRVPELAERNHLACLRLLLDAGADPNDHFIAYERYVQTALTGVAGEGEQGIPPLPQARAMAELLLDTGADPHDSQLLYNTHFRPETEWLELLLARGLKQGQRTNWDPDGPTTIDYLLCQAASNGHQRRVELLLAAGANPDAPSIYNRRTAYVNALRHGHDEVARLLLTAGAKSVPEPEDELRIALQALDETRVGELLAVQPGLIEDREAMCELASEGKIAAIRLLLKHGVDVNAPNRNGRLGIQEAAIRGNRELVMLLVEHGTRLDYRDPGYGGSVIGWASAGGHIELREELLDRTNDVFDLTRYGRIEQLKRLLELSPEAARQVTRHGSTPLHQVCGMTPHAEEIMDLLLSSGAELNAKNDKGETPLAVQEEPEDDAIVELLKARGAI